MKASPPISRFEFEVVFIDAHGKVFKRDRRQAQFFSETLGNGIVLEMVQIPEGTTQIGSPNTEVGRSDDEEEQHSVTLTSFFIGKYPITQAQWRAVALLPKVNRILNPDPSAFKGLNRPVEQVSWCDAIEFCARLSRVTGRSYRLPTEVEWEYACRAGTLTPFHFGETLTTDLANYCGEDHYRKHRTSRGILYKGAYGKGPTGIDRRRTTEFGSFQVGNAFGLYDLHGNVWEWCSGYPHESGLDAVDSWFVPMSEEDCCQLPLRGGSWKSSPAACRSASRLSRAPSCQESFVGFRVVCSATTSDRASSEEPSQGIPSQSILTNVPVGGNLTLGNITQIFTGSTTQSADTYQTSSQKRTILILASSPVNEARLRQDKEAREINLGLQRSKHREQFDLKQRWAVCPDDLRRALLELEPQIVHFSGHGAGTVGLALENEAGKAQWVSADALATLFRQFANRGLECLVLNACYSDVQAAAIVQHIPCVIGMSNAISDSAAIKFAVGFYDALGAGWSYEDAYEHGKSAIALEGIPEELTPILKKKRYS